MRGRGGVLGNVAFAVCAAAAGTPACAEGAAAFDNVIGSRFIHCAFHAGYPTDPASGAPLLQEDRATSLTHIQRIDLARGVARAISTRKAGAREVRIAREGRYLHFIDHVAGMYVLTTVHSCIGRDERTGVCLTYGASQARHFDARVTVDPDRVFEALRAHADPGFCDHSFVGMQEATHRAR